ncbi:unnamed protein product [Durusdinium trenchii]|uniref:EF-hand domain-containing protein n=1 Tax=Durusdinium trenchii TaxID=1381693 RepID=A0ABP0IDC4_9DINO
MSAQLTWTLRELQKQQHDSLAAMDLLRQQHEEWQQCVTTLLGRFDGLQASERLQASDQVPGEMSESVSEIIFSQSTEVIAEEVRDPHLGLVPISEATEGEQGTETAAIVKKWRQTHGTDGRFPKLLEEVLEARGQATHSMTIWGHRHQTLKRVVESNAFEYITGVLILANIGLIGVEAEMSLLQIETAWAQDIERVFLALYTVELLLRLAAGGRRNFKSAWFLLDLFLVCVGLIALVVVPLVESETSSQEGWMQLLIVRGLRLLRLARVLRTVKRFKVVWRLVSGLLSVWDVMASTTFLILLWLYIFGCIAAEVIASDPELQADSDTAVIVTKNFSSLPRATLTLLQFVTLDGIANIYYPLVMAKPILIVYFLPLLLFLSIALMNLVTAVLVEHALEHASQEAELARIRTKEQIKATLPELLDIFSALDKDDSGYITREEVANVSLHVLPKTVLEKVTVDSMEDMFELLDVDGGGSLSLAEFLDGLLLVLLMDMPSWAVQLQKLVIPIRRQTIQISNELELLKRGRDPGENSPGLTVENARL